MHPNDLRISMSENAYFSGAVLAITGGQFSAAAIENLATSTKIVAVTSLKVSATSAGSVVLYPYGASDLAAGTNARMLGKGQNSSGAGSGNAALRYAYNANIDTLFGVTLSAVSPITVPIRVANEFYEIIEDGPLIISPDECFALMPSVVNVGMSVRVSWQELGG